MNQNPILDTGGQFPLALDNPVTGIPVKVIYHANCDDGFGAAWAAWKFYKESRALHGVEFIPAKYGDVPPDVKGCNVLIVDFSYKRSTLAIIKNEAKSLVVLDHHKTAEEDLRGFPGTVFDMNRSGAVITWNYLFPNRDVPRLLQYVQDNDLWRHKLPACQAAVRYIRSFPQVFDHWDALASEFEFNAENVMQGAISIERYFQNQIQFQKGHARFFQYKGLKAAIINVNTTFVSEMCTTIIADNYLDLCFGWFMNKDGEFMMSIRGHGDTDVSAIAKEYGGGGHKSAAGFTFSFDEFKNFYLTHIGSFYSV